MGISLHGSIIKWLVSSWTGLCSVALLFTPLKNLFVTCAPHQTAQMFDKPGTDIVAQIL